MADRVAGRSLQAPQGVMASLDVSPSDAPGEPVKRVTERNADELQHVVVAVLREAPPDSVVAIVGAGKYSAESLLRHGEAGTPLGRESFSGSPPTHTRIRCFDIDAMLDVVLPAVRDQSAQSEPGAGQ